MHAALDIRGQQFRPEGTQLVAVVGQPVDHGCRIVGGDHDGVVWADTLLGDDGDAILRRRRRRFLEADKGREQEATVVNTFLPFEEEHRLRGKLQLVEQFVVTDRQGRPATVPAVVALSSTAVKTDRLLVGRNIVVSHCSSRLTDGGLPVSLGQPL